ncbi:hypothetical protein BS78_01G339500, partial [Paspalum vaginatum]
LFTSNAGHPSLHQRHRQQPSQIQSAAAALPVTFTAQSASSQVPAVDSVCSGMNIASCCCRSHRPIRAVPVPPQQQVAFVDLVDSDDDTEELDLELKL